MCKNHLGYVKKNQRRKRRLLLKTQNKTDFLREESFKKIAQKGNIPLISDRSVFFVVDKLHGK